mgnify:CR=1 FL=1
MTKSPIANRQSLIARGILVTILLVAAFLRLYRLDEIPPGVDISRWSRYWQEAFNGVVMRMALLALVNMFQVPLRASKICKPPPVPKTMPNPGSGQ